MAQGTRYWDGNAWVDPPSPGGGETPRPSRRAMLLGALGLLAVLVALVTLAVSAGTWWQLPGGGHSLSEFTTSGAPPSPGAPVAVPAALDNPATRLVAAETVRLATTGCVSSGYAVGSGWPVSPFTIATAAHVVGGAHSIEVQTPGKATALGTVVFWDAAHDVALIHVDGTRHTPLPMATTDQTELRAALIVGYPARQPEAAVSATTEGSMRVDSPWPPPDGTQGLLSLPYNAHNVGPGFSGGPMVSSQGVVMGITDQQDGDGSQGGFAVGASQWYAEITAAATQTTEVDHRPCNGT